MTGLTDMKNSRFVSTPAYDERLTVPLRWWVQGVMFLATLWIAVILWIPAALAWGITAAIVGLFTLAMIVYGNAKITIADGVLRAGPARIEARFLGEAIALDETEARHLAGRDADARAYLLLRPYLKRAVRVTIEDPADPAPYWLLFTRHPVALAKTVNALRASL